LSRSNVRIERKDYCSQHLASLGFVEQNGATMSVVTIRSSQKVFTEEEVAGLTGISLDHLRDMARSKHLGFVGRVAQVAGDAEKWLFTNSDVMVLNVLYPRCEH
jgi:hypothetical protein